MPGGPAKRLAKFAKDCKEERLRPFSSYKTKKDLSEVLRKYGVEDERITYILQFVPKTHPMMTTRLGNMGIVVESNEAIYCEYISSIFHACIHIVKNLAGKEITLNPQLEVVEGKQHQIAIGFAQNVLSGRPCGLRNQGARGTNLHHGGEATPNSHGFAQNVVQCESDYQANKRRFRKGLRLTLLVMESSPRLRNGTFSSKSRKEFHARVKSNTTLVPPRPTLENEAELRKNVKG
ncbi:unnamed protein product [Rhizophagus irregularis]|nr:unnamed protein product [Rhizophagus irregularis]